MKIALSLFLSLLTAATVWFVLPLLVLPPIAMLLGGLSYREAVKRGDCPTLARKLVYLTPIWVALLSVVWGFWLLTTQYNA